MIDRFGYRDITEHDIQKILYHEPLLNGLQTPLTPFTAMKAIPEPQPAVTIDEQITAKKTPLQETRQGDEEPEEYDPLLKQINPKSF
ncbi:MULTISPECIES: hypothetical protein [Paenibacillus]|jgi:hypothetical protein|uniref:hypothetical protein n=1 Tax=Paenibacillus TaxID=44249 RepID=UPI0011B2734A|nr:MULTISPECIES: hypothetical protein [Paenibacillus]KAF6614305.1 hypothetical protein HFE00_25555 [Paenibacillus sp. EKM101P]KAF6616661.1 hypothetical protein HFE03_25385 [Paenibacillus sp. EKM102P]KAF6625115.1 hypothetical protein HFE01_25685 [Paenibacillus sp. EKM10P]